VTSKPDFKVMVLLLVFMQLTRDLFAIAKFLFIILFECLYATICYGSWVTNNGSWVTVQMGHWVMGDSP